MPVLDVRLSRARLPALGWSGLVRLPLACLFLLPLWGLLTSNPSISSRVFIAGLFVGSLVRPADALLVLAGLLLVAHALGGALQSPYSLAEPMVLAFLGGWLLSSLRTRQKADTAASPALVAAVLFAAVIAASVLTQLLVERAMQDFYWPYFKGLFSALANHYLDAPAELPAVNAGAPMIEGLALFAAVATLGRARASADRLARMVVAGTAGLAALNVLRYAQLWLATPDGQAASIPPGLRISTVGDYNAVGSYLAMMLLVAIGLAVAEKRARVAWIGAAVLILAATWLTQSRAALLAIPGALLFFTALVTRVRLRSSWWKPVVALTCALVLLVVIVARFKPPDDGVRPVGANLYGRLQMTQVGLHLFQRAPLFGVGVGRFWGLSAAYMPVDLLARNGNENAHNNFVQILAELGATGLLLYLLVLAFAARLALRSLGRESNARLAAVVCGLVAFLVSSLAGHPLLVRHACYAFWLTLGIAVAFGASPADVAPTALPHGGWKKPVAIFLLFLAASVPVRADRFLRHEANLSGVEIGFSPWQSDASGKRFRTFTGRAEFYVRSDSRFIRLDMQRAGESSAEVEVRLDGKLANRVHAPLGNWASVQMIVPASPHRYSRVEFRTSNGSVVRTGELATGPREVAKDAAPDASDVLPIRPRSVRSGSITDGKSDVVWRHATRGEVWLWTMKGASNTARIFVGAQADVRWEIRAVADLTGDGWPDILWRHKTTGEIALWPMSGSTPGDQVVVGALDPGCDVVGTGDFNGDGKSDLLLRHLNNGDVWIWLMDGPTPMRKMYLGRVDPSYVVAGVGDLDGDGKADIVWHHATRGDVWVWLMDAVAVRSRTLVGTMSDTAYQIKAVADFNGDGKADILWHHAKHGDVWLWTMDGTRLAAARYVRTVPDTNYRIVTAGDYDGDGKADVVWHHTTRGEVWVWLMNGRKLRSRALVGAVPDLGYQIVK